MASTSSSASQERIKQYRLGITLGIGSFGKVKLGVHEATGIPVAIKILNKKRVKSMDMAGKIWREINILKLFVHPHIIRLYEIIDTATDIYVVMEHVEGGELFEYIVAKGRLSEDEARKFFQQIVAGVEYCHRHMVVHRDLKPENLLISKDLCVKIADFGLSNIMRDGAFFETSCGSPNYAAPEVISGQLYAGAEVDVWSIGVILYALLCGSLPFDDENVANLFKKIKGGVYSLPSHLSDLSRDLIPKLLVVDPLQRLTIAEIRQHPWFQQKLPAYLAQLPDMRPPQQQEIVQSVVDEVCRKLGYDADAVIAAVQNGDMNDYAVSYNLILDQTRHQHQSLRSTATISIPGGPSHPREEFPEFQQSLSVSWHQDHIAPSLGSSASVASVSSAAGGGGMSSGDPAPRVGGMGAGSWFLGVPTRLPPREAMMELLRVLKLQNYMWKFISPYKLKCIKDLPTQLDMSSAEAPSTAGSFIKIAINMYKRRDGQGYIVDIWNMEGSTQIFLVMAQQIVSELKV